MKGNVIGTGRTATVYEYGLNVLKLYNAGYPKEWVEYEMKCQKIASENGALVPEVIDYYEENNQYGIIFQKIEGRTLRHYLQKDNKNLNKYAKKYAEIMLSYHGVSLEEGIMREIDYESKIKAIDSLTSVQKDKLVKLYQSLPKQHALCHGDFHPDNVMVASDKYVVIDWLTGYMGDPASDIARSVLLLETPYGRMNLPWYIRIVAYFLVKRFKYLFLKNYFKQSSVTKKQVEKWMPIIYAVRLLEEVDNEKEWVLKKLHKMI